jgi:hypothetical protein
MDDAQVILLASLPDRCGEMDQHKEMTMPAQRRAGNVGHK